MKKELYIFPIEYRDDMKVFSKIQDFENKDGVDMLRLSQYLKIKIHQAGARKLYCCELELKTYKKWTDYEAPEEKDKIKYSKKL